MKDEIILKINHNEKTEHMKVECIQGFNLIKNVRQLNKLFKYGEIFEANVTKSSFIEIYRVFTGETLKSGTEFSKDNFFKYFRIIRDL